MKDGSWTYGWEGKADDELRKLYELYYERFGDYPDMYAYILYNCMTYEEWSAYIQECLDRNLTIPHVVV